MLHRSSLRRLAAAFATTAALTTALAAASAPSHAAELEVDDGVNDYWVEDADRDEIGGAEEESVDITATLGSTSKRSGYVVFGMERGYRASENDVKFVGSATFTATDHTYKTVRKNGKKRKVIVKGKSTSATFRATYRTQTANDFSLEQKTSDGWVAAKCPGAFYQHNDDGYYLDFYIPRGCLGLKSPDVAKATFNTTVWLEYWTTGTAYDIARLPSFKL